MKFDSNKFKENISNFLNPVKIWKCFTDFGSETLLMRFFNIFFTCFITILLWVVLPLTVLILFLDSVNIDGGVR